MAVTEVWLEVKNGRTTVLDAESARQQHKRWHKKRKAAQAHAHRPKKRKPNTEQMTRDEESEPVEPHENLQLFADAQAQLQHEMEAAGFGDNALPLSFGSTHASAATSSRKRKRQRHHDPSDVVEDTSSSQLAPSAPVAMEKVHVTFDSDGEIAERVVETVEAPTVIPPEEDATEAPVDEAEEVEATTTEAAVVETTEPATPTVDPTVLKFWKQRRTLFHKYDEGIQLDHESWYSVTPESIARHIAQRCACDVIVDPFSGCGGNIIQFAQTCKQVIAIEIDAEKIRMAKANAAIYGVADRIEWIHGDALDVLPTLRADVVFLSPPWGGMDYNRSRFGIADMMVGSTSGVELFEMARRVAKNVVYYLPKTTPEAELQALAPEEAVECEHIHLNGQLKVVNAYYGDLALAGHREREGIVDSDDTPMQGGENGSGSEAPPSTDQTTQDDS